MLDRIIEYGVNRKVNWKVNPDSESKLWRDFEREVVEYMASHPSVLHAHTYSISVETYLNIPKLHNFMKITQTDFYERDGEEVEYIVSMEAKDYPIYATMYHPEYQTLTFDSKLKWVLVANDITDRIAYRISRRLFLDAL